MLPLSFDNILLPSRSWTEVFPTKAITPSQCIVVAETRYIDFFPVYLKCVKLDFVACSATKYILGKECVGNSTSPNPVSFDSMLMASDIVRDFDGERVCEGICNDRFHEIDFIAGASKYDATWRSDE